MPTPELEALLKQTKSTGIFPDAFDDAFEDAFDDAFAEPLSVEGSETTDNILADLAELLTGFFISDAEVEIVLETLGGLFEIDINSPIKDSAFGEVVRKLRDYEEGDLLEELFSQFDFTSHSDHLNTYIKLSFFLPAEEAGKNISKALGIQALSFLDPTKSDEEQKKQFVSNLVENFDAFLFLKLDEIRTLTKADKYDEIEDILVEGVYPMVNFVLDILFADPTAKSDFAQLFLEKGLEIWEGLGSDVKPVIDFSEGGVPIDKFGAPLVKEEAGEAEVKEPEDKSLAELITQLEADVAKNKAEAAKPPELAELVTQQAKKVDEFFNELEIMADKDVNLLKKANDAMEKTKKKEIDKLGGDLKALFESRRGEQLTTLKEGDTENLNWIDLIRIWFWEIGSVDLKKIEFGQNAITTPDVIGLKGTQEVIQSAKNRFINGTLKDRRQFTAQVNYKVGHFKNAVKERDKAFNFLGTYEITVTPTFDTEDLSKVTLEYLVFNKASMASFTRFLAPIEGENQPILTSRDRDSEGVNVGGTVETTWTWKEVFTKPSFGDPIPELPVNEPDKTRVATPVVK